MPNGERMPAKPIASAPVAERSPAEQPAADPQGPAPIAAVIRALSEVCEHLRQLAQVRADQVRLEVRNRVRDFLLRVAFVLLAIVVAMISLGYFISGAALGLAAACGGRIWLGYLLTGAMFLSVAIGALFATELRARARAFGRLSDKYPQPSHTAPQENTHAVRAEK